MVTHWPTSAATVVSLPRLPEDASRPPQRPVWGGAGMCAGIASRAGGVEVVTVGGGPHGGGALVIVETCSPNLGEHIFRNPSTKLTVTGNQPPPLIQRRAIGKPSINGVCLTGCDTPKRPLRSIGEATTAPCMGRGGPCVRRLPAARAVSKSS